MNPPPHSSLRPVPYGALGLFGLVHGLSCWLGMRLITECEHISALWPSSGVLLTALLLMHVRHWPAVLSLALVLTALLTATGPRPDLGNFIMAGGNLLEALAGAWLLRRFAGFRPSLERVRDVLSLLGLAVFFSPMLSATPGTLLLMLAGKVARGAGLSTWRVFWAGDAMGVLLVAPMLLSWSSRGRAGWSRPRGVEFLLLLLALGLTLHLAFQWEPRRLASDSLLHPASYAAFPFMLWAALRFEARGASAVLGVLSAVAVWQTLAGHGPFALHVPGTAPTEGTLSPTLSLLFLQSFLAAVGTSGLLLAAVHSETRLARKTASRLNRELRASLDSLAAAQQELVLRERMAALGELSASVAHEVRNPLAVIANSLATLHRLAPPEPGETRGQLLGIMREEVTRLDHLVHGLLDFARPTTPRLLPQPLEAVVEGALESALRSEPGAGRIAVTRTFDPALPQAPLDAQLLHLALSNLFANALQAMPQGGALRVELGPGEERSGRPQARVLIADTGPGIPPEVMARLFEPFFTTKAAGTGLGLAIVRRIVEAHHGRVEVRSAPGEGTAFTVHLPLGPRVAAG